MEERILDMTKLFHEVHEVVKEKDAMDIFFVFDEITRGLLVNSSLSSKEIKEHLDWRTSGILKAIKEWREKDGNNSPIS